MFWFLLILKSLSLVTWPAYDWGYPCFPLSQKFLKPVLFQSFVGAWKWFNIYLKFMVILKVSLSRPLFDWGCCRFPLSHLFYKSVTPFKAREKGQIYVLWLGLNYCPLSLNRSKDYPILLPSVVPLSAPCFQVWQIRNSKLHVLLALEKWFGIHILILGITCGSKCC